MITDNFPDDISPPSPTGAADQKSDLSKFPPRSNAFYNPIVMDTMRIHTEESFEPVSNGRRDHFLSDLPAGFGLKEEEDRGPFSSAGMAGWSVEQVCGVVAVSVIVPFILVSNLLVMVSVARYKRLQMPTNYFIVSLAAGDIFVAVITPFFIVIEVLPGQVENPVLCLSPNRILMTACGVSVLTMAAIAYDRHTALVNPLKYVSLITPRKIAIVVASIWFYSATIVWVPVALGWFSSVSGTQVSEVQPCSFQLLHDTAHVLFLGAIFGPACVVIIVCYFRIYVLARQHARAIAAVESSVHHNLRVRFMMRDAKYAKTLALVMGVFLVLWAPYLASLVTEVVTSIHISPWLWNYLTLMAVLNSGLNPWIYAFKNNDFRTAFRRTLKACFSACCRLDGRSFCSRVLKSSRRSSALSGVTTPTTQSRSSRSSHGSTIVSGRLSDVSCVIGVTAENVNKVFDANRRRSLVNTISASVSASFEKEAILRSMTESTEKRVSTLLNADSREFIEDLFSLYIHHSFVHRHSGIDAESCEDDIDCEGQIDRSDHPKTHIGKHLYHIDHAYQSDDTWHCDCIHSDCADCCYQYVHSSDVCNCHHVYHSETHSFHSDHTYQSDHAYHSDVTEDTCISSTGHVCHSDRVYQSDHTNDSCLCSCSHHCCHSESIDQSYLTDKRCHRDSTLRKITEDSTDSLCCAHDTNQCCCVDTTQHSDSGDHTDRGYHSDQSDSQDKGLEPPGV